MRQACSQFELCNSPDHAESPNYFNARIVPAASMLSPEKIASRFLNASEIRPALGSYMPNCVISGMPGWYSTRDLNYEAWNFAAHHPGLAHESIMLSAFLFVGLNHLRCAGGMAGRP